MSSRHYFLRTEELTYLKRSWLMMHKGTIRSIAISAARGQLKKEVPQAEVVEGYGIKGDGHAGPWGRQVTCLDWASVKKVNRERGMQAGPRDFE